MRKRLFCLLTGIVCAMSFTMVHSATKLNSDTNIRIDFSGKYGNTDLALRMMLEKYLKKVLKRKTLEGPNGDVVFDINIKYPKWQDIPPQELNDIREIDSFTIDTRTDNIIKICSNTAIGAGFAVTEFLERFLDVYWLYPGELGECIPDIDPEKGITIKPELIKKQPIVLSRVYTGLKFRDPDCLKKLPYKGVVHTERYYFKAFDYQKFLKLHHVIYSSHNMINIFNRKKHFGKVDEIFPIINGKRYFPPEKPEKGHHGGSGRWQGWHPCYSSEKAVEIATQAARKFFDAKKGLVFSLGINDGANMWCHCEKCNERGWVNAYYDFVSKVANNVREEYPNFLIGVLAYGGVGIPPKELKLPDNVLVNSTGHIEDWLNKANNLSKYEYFYGWGFWVPSFPLEAVKQRGKMYRENGIIGLHAEVHPLWAFDGPKINIFSKLLWDDTLDTDAELKKYCKKGYGDAWQEIYDFYKLWADYSRRFHSPPEKHGLSPELGIYFRRSTNQLAAVPEDVKKKARELLNAAEKKLLGDKEKLRFFMLDTYYKYTENLFASFELSKMIFTYNKDVDYLALAKQIEARINERKNILNLMRQNKEWGAGSYQDVDKILGNTWEGRWEWTIDYEVQNALRTALYNAWQENSDKKTGFKILPDYAKYYTDTELTPWRFKIIMKPWKRYYHNDGYVPVQTIPQEGAVIFKMRREKAVRVDENAKHKYLGTKEGFKKVYFRGDSKLNQGESYLFDVDLKASGGTVDVIINNENDCGKKIYLKYPFNTGVKQRKLRFVMEPVKYWGNKRDVIHWSVVVMFLPEVEDSSFEGKCRISKINFKK